MAADLGKRLLAEVEEVGLDEILQTIRFRHDPGPAHFGISALDKIINTAILDKSNPPASPPVLELGSQATGSGTTHLLYLITATAILPASLGGKNSCVAILDTENNFSVSRLVQQLRLTLPPNSSPSSIPTALTHVHIFRPQSLTSLNATLKSLPDYFFRTHHPSLHRPLAFIALDSLTAFHWQSKAAEEDRAFAHQHPSETGNEENKDPQPPASTPSDLNTLLKATALRLNTPLLLTTHSVFSTNNTPCSTLATVRLTVSRRTVRNFPPTISVAEALRETKDRQRAVDASNWEVRVAESSSGNLRGRGFDFKITREGVRLENEGKA